MLEFCLRAAVTAVVGYFCGCFNGSVIVSKYILRDDVRTHGSGNAGLTNFYRTFGGPLTLVVILTDVLKAIVAVYFGIFMATQLSAAGQILGPSAAQAAHALVEAASGNGSALGLLAVLDGGAFDYTTLAKYWAGTFCMLGHIFPCMFRFKGGKGILSGGTIAIMIDWRVALVVWGGFLILAVLTKWVSLGSIWAGASFPFATWFVFRSVSCTILAVVCGGLILWKHRGNMKRILKGEESKFSLHHKKEDKP